jgi:hypothetical protein
VVAWLRGGRLGFIDLRLISPSPNVARERTDLSLSLVVEFCWFVVVGGGVLLNFWWGFVGLWWLVVGLLLILWWVLWWVTMALSMGMLSGGCVCCDCWFLLVIADG